MCYIRCPVGQRCLAIAISAASACGVGKAFVALRHICRDPLVTDVSDCWRDYLAPSRWMHRYPDVS